MLKREVRWGYFPFGASANFKICFRTHVAITCENVEGVSLKRACLKKPETEEDVKILQSPQTSDQTPILIIFEILAGAPSQKKMIMTKSTTF